MNNRNLLIITITLIICISIIVITAVNLTNVKTPELNITNNTTTAEVTHTEEQSSTGIIDSEPNGRQLTRCPNCGSTNLDSNRDHCWDCGYNEPSDYRPGTGYCTTHGRVELNSDNHCPFCIRDGLDPRVLRGSIVY